MIILTNSNEAASANVAANTEIYVSYTDTDITNNTILPGKATYSITTNSTNYQLLVGQAGITRIIKSIYVYTTNSSYFRFKIIYTDASGSYSLWAGLLDSTDIVYYNGSGWQKISAGLTTRSIGLPSTTPKLVERFAVSGNSSVTNPVTSGYKFLMYKLWGAGGGGGGGSYGTTNVARHGGGGGGGGACLHGVMAVDSNMPLSSGLLSIIIGAGGTAGAGAGTTVGSGQAGTAGGDTYIVNSNLIAYGGGGGAPGTNAAAATSGGGGGGTASAGSTGGATAAAGGRPGTAASTGVAGGTGASSTITAITSGTVGTYCSEYGGAAGAGQPATASGESSGGSSLFGGAGGGHGACQSSTQTLVAAGQGGNSNSYVAGGVVGGGNNLYLGIFGGSGGSGGSVKVVSGFDGSLNSIAIQSDGKILVGGYQTSYNGITQQYITRLNSDGTKDMSFSSNPGFNNGVFSIAVQSDGKILVGGGFTDYDGTTQNRIIRLNSDGTRDTSFSIGTGFSSYVRSIAIQSDGKILVGGGFTDYNGTTQNYITRLNSDGTRDTSFNIGSGFTGAGGSVLSIAIQSDGKILVGGNFTSYNGTAQGCMTRLNSDGTRDTGFNTGFNSIVYSIAIQSDGKIVVGGEFTNYYGITQNYITRLNSDSTRDTGFNIGTAFDNIVRSIAIQSDGKIVVGGSFSTYNGTGQNNITRLNSDGTRDTSFSIGTGANDWIYFIGIQNDGKILIGGNLISYNSVTTPINYITRLNSDGTRDTSFSGAQAASNGNDAGGGGGGGSSGNATVGAATAGGNGGNGYAILYWW